MNASTPFLGGSPLSFSSGWINPPEPTIKGMFKVKRVYWEKPTLASTSSVLITKRTATGMTYVKMDIDSTSGATSQNLNIGDQWWQDPCVNCVPTGTLYVYLDDK